MIVTIEDGRDMRNFIKGDREEHMLIKNNLKMLKYQKGVFQRELNRVSKNYKELIDGQNRRKENYGTKFSTVEELNEAYAIGQVSDEEYFYQYRAWWQTYSDRGYPERIAWLTEQRDRYQAKLDALTEYMGEKREKSIKRYEAKRRQRKKHATAQRRYMKRKRKQMKEELWRKHGLI